MIPDRYYYNRLSEKEKAVYKSVYSAILNLQSDVTVAGRVTMPTLQKITAAITNDNPHLYYFNQIEMQLCGNLLQTQITLRYYYSHSEIHELNKKIEEVVNKIVRNLHLEKTDDDYERVRLVHDTLASHVSYDHTAVKTTDKRRLASAHSIVGVFLDKRAVCDGIAKAAKILLNTANINCIVVTGTAALEDGGGHAWNIVRIDGQAYHLDVTWDIANSTKKFINYDYFNLPDSDISRDHGDYHGVPVCNSLTANYFAKNSLVFNDLKAAHRHVRFMVQKGCYTFQVRWDSKTFSLEAAASQLVNSAIQEVAKDGYPWAAKYVVNDRQNTILVELSVRV